MNLEEIVTFLEIAKKCRETGEVELHQKILKKIDKYIDNEFWQIDLKESSWVINEHNNIFKELNID